MASEPCAQCGWTNSEELKYCVGCGVYRSDGIDRPRSAVTPSQVGVGHDGSAQLMIGTTRVLILSVLGPVSAITRWRNGTATNCIWSTLAAWEGGL